ncbi:hypothetical protein CHS0354_015481 [Potamilus streckersoni]|uniref:DNA repair protein XRCC1 n=1 Tax=Potamilus streckersoni TaxID=2493646 RepID=A0AAE0VV96_9BIVA|nr:hypothetical protein CHS0354_015481 [Potamilus streckersoni]
MPEIKIQHVISCSSEDKSFPADNLLKPEGTFKWKCATPGEKHASVILQLEKFSQISFIHIGNEGSAFVEVLVGRSTATEKDFQVLLVTSAFMSPLDSRSGTNRTSVRMFGPDQLCKETANEKWDSIKVVCTQPFNKTSTYGLSFIKFMSPSDPKEKGEPVQKKLGFFIVKGDGDSDDITTGSLFASRGKSEMTAEPAKHITGAAAARTASRLAEEKKSAASPYTYTAKTVETKPSPTQNREKRKHEISDDEEQEERKEKKQVGTPKPSLRKQSTSLSSSASSTKDESHTPQLKKSKSEPVKASPAKKFGELMKKVVFVLSGFQNPFRGELRDKALEMGALYKPDWEKGCTHLVCAFTNTPKYNQVRQKGKIVKKEWILECYKQKKLLPWRKYRLGDAASPPGSSEEEEEPVKMSPPQKRPFNPDISPKYEEKSSQKSQESIPLKKAASSNDGEEDTDENNTKSGDSGEDTEDEIRRVKERLAIKTTAMADDKEDNKDKEDIYGVSTDEDEPVPGTSKDQTLMLEEDEEIEKEEYRKKEGDGDNGSDSGLPELPDFFTEKHFFLYGDFKSSDRRLLNRYIAAYNGELEEYMNEKVHYIITNSAWDDNFDEALTDKPGLIFVKPKWIYMCHEKSKLVPYQPYIVVPGT